MKIRITREVASNIINALEVTVNKEVPNVISRTSIMVSLEYILEDTFEVLENWEVYDASKEK